VKVPPLLERERERRRNESKTVIAFVRIVVRPKKGSDAAMPRLRQRFRLERDPGEILSAKW